MHELTPPPPPLPGKIHVCGLALSLSTSLCLSGFLLKKTVSLSQSLSTDFTLFQPLSVWLSLKKKNLSLYLSF